jgi:hypothetical protein
VTIWTEYRTEKSELEQLLLFDLLLMSLHLCYVPCTSVNVPVAYDGMQTYS